MAGLGFGVAVVPLTSAVLGHVPAARSGMAASATNTARQLGAVVGVAALGAIVNGYLTHDFGATLRARGTSADAADYILGLLETGGSDAAGIDLAHPAAIIKSLVDAATAAFRTGMHIALLVSAALILVAARSTALVPEPRAARPTPNVELSLSRPRPARRRPGRRRRARRAPARRSGRAWSARRRRCAPAPRRESGRWSAIATSVASLNTTYGGTFCASACALRQARSRPNSSASAASGLAAFAFLAGGVLAQRCTGRSPSRNRLGRRPRRCPGLRASAQDSAQPLAGAGDADVEQPAFLGDLRLRSSRAGSAASCR